MKQLFGSLIFFITAFLIVSCQQQTQPSDALPKNQLMDIQISNDDYVKMLENKFQNLEFPINIEFDGAHYSGTIRPSGASSRIKSRWSYRIELNAGQSINGLQVFNLSAQISDSTMLATDVASYFYRQADFASFEHSHIFLRINGKDDGLKKMIEKVDEAFFDRRQLSVSELYKSGSRISFSFEQGDPNSLPQLSFDKDIPKDDNFNSVDQLYYALDSGVIRDAKNSIEQHLDIKQYLKYHAITSFINNKDAFENNFFLWKSTPTTPFKMIPWDFDWAFDRRTEDELYGSNAIIRIMLKDREMFEFYKLELENLVNNLDLQNDVFALMDEKSAEIKAAFNLDPFLNEVYDLDEQSTKLKNFLTQRKAFFIDELDDFYFDDDDDEDDDHDEHDEHGDDEHDDDDD